MKINYKRLLEIYQRIVEKKNWRFYDNRMVFMFHDVPQRIEEGYNIKYSISAASFEHCIEMVLRTGYSIVSPDEIIVADGRKKILLTFDDVFLSVYENAFSILKERNLPFAIFPATELVGKQGYINIAMLQEMIDYSDCYLGGHSVTHGILRNMSKEQSEREIIVPKRWMKENLEMEISMMAYPYGAVGAVGKREIKIAANEYKYAFSTLQTCFTSKSNLYFIPRINVNENNYKNILNAYLK